MSTCSKYWVTDIQRYNNPVGLARIEHTILRLATFDVADDTDGCQCVDADESEEQDEESVHLAKTQHLIHCKQVWHSLQT